MVADPLRKVCVILGAGASFDVHGAGSDLCREEFRPTLAQDLFNFDQRDGFREILKDYAGAIVLAQGLASRSGLPEFDIEKELKRGPAVRPEGQRRAGWGAGTTTA